MATGYSKMVLPFNQVKEKEFLSRPMGCKGVGFSFVRYKPGEGATYVHRHKVQEEVFITLKGTGSIILDGSAFPCPKGPSCALRRGSIALSATTRTKM